MKEDFNMRKLILLLFLTTTVCFAQESELTVGHEYFPIQENGLWTYLTEAKDTFFLSTPIVKADTAYMELDLKRVPHYHGSLNIAYSNLGENWVIKANKDSILFLLQDVNSIYKVKEHIGITPKHTQLLFESCMLVGNKRISSTAYSGVYTSRLENHFDTFEIGNIVYQDVIEVSSSYEYQEITTYYFLAKGIGIIRLDKTPNNGNRIKIMELESYRIKTPTPEPPEKKGGYIKSIY